MAVRVAALTLLAVLAGCHRALRQSTLQSQVDTGTVVDFGAPDGPSQSWDFGDGSARVQARQAQHAFLKAGRYVVQGTLAGESAERVELVVIPRPLVRAVPEDAEGLVWVPTLKEDLGPTVDFLERVAGAGNVLGGLEQSWLPALAVELSMGDGSVVDPHEGVGLMVLPGFPGQIALLGVVDADRAMAALAQKLTSAGAEENPKTEGGVRTFVAAWGSAKAFVDRGYLYLVQPDADGEDGSKAIARVRAGGQLGLQAYAPFAQSAAALGDGNLWFYARDGREVPDGARLPLVQSVVAGVRVGAQSATLEGVVRTSRPIQRSPAMPAMFARGAEGPVVALKLSLPPGDLADFALGAGGTGTRSSLLRNLSAAGVDTNAAINAFSGEVGALAWFDAEGFLKNLVSGTGKPQWRGVFHLIAGVVARDPVAPLVTSLLGDAVRAPYADDRDALLWQRKLSTATVTIALTPKVLMIRSGEGSGPRTNVDLGKELGQRFNGAFGPGHSSLLLDLGRLKKELEAPRDIAGVDASKVVTVQGFSAGFLEQLTPVDHLVLDFAPDESGGKLWGMIVLRPR